MAEQCIRVVPGSHQHNAKPFDIENEVVWTASRCNRLLRPLSSRLLLLEKTYHQSGPNGLTTNLGDRSNCAGESCSESRNGSKKRKDGFYEEDPEWIPVKKSKRKARQQYTRRTVRLPSRNEYENCKPLKANMAPGEVVVPTPIIARRLSIPHMPTQSKTISKNARTEDLSRLKPGKSEKLCESNILIPKASLPKEVVQEFEQAVEPEIRTLVNGIISALDCLLRSTKECQGSSAEGSPTLLSMCLRKIPDYMFEHEASLQEMGDLPEGTNISSEVYSELEIFGASKSGGWASLKHVARAHGISMLRRAIHEYLLTEKTVRGLVLVCIRNSAFREAEVLLSAMLSAYGTFEKPTTTKSRLFDISQSVSLHTLRIFVKASGRCGYQYGQLNTLFRHGHIPLQWLATEDMVTLWSQILQTGCNNLDGCVEGMDLIFSTLRQLCHLNSTSLEEATHSFRLQPMISQRQKKLRPRTPYFDETSSQFKRRPLNRIPPLDHDTSKSSLPLENTFSSIGVILTTISLMHQKHSNGTVDMRQPPYIQLSSLAVDIERTIQLQVLRPRENIVDHLHHQRALKISLANYSISGLIEDSLKELPSVMTQRSLDVLLTLLKEMRGVSVSQPVLDCTSKFLCSIARCCGRVLKDDGFGYLQEIVCRLFQYPERNPIDISREDKKLLAQIGLDSAMQFAEQTCSPEHLQYAQDMEKHMIDCGLVQGDSQHKTVDHAESNLTRFRWDEGICEWVAASPPTGTQPRASGTNFTNTIVRSTSNNDLETSLGDVTKHNEYLTEHLTDCHNSQMLDSGSWYLEAERDDNTSVPQPAIPQIKHGSINQSSGTGSFIPFTPSGPLKRHTREASPLSVKFQFRGNTKLTTKCPARCSIAGRAIPVSEFFQSMSHRREGRQIGEHSDEDELATGMLVARVKSKIPSRILKEISNPSGCGVSASSAEKPGYGARHKSQKARKKVRRFIDKSKVSLEGSEDELCQSI